MVKKALTIILGSFFASIAFMLAAMLTGLTGIITLIVSSFVFGVVIYIYFRHSNLLETIMKFIITLCFIICMMFAVWHFELFKDLFVKLYGERPSPGTGFGLLLSFAINILSFIIVFVCTLVLNKVRTNDRN